MGTGAERGEAAAWQNPQGDCWAEPRGYGARSRTMSSDESEYHPFVFAAGATAGTASPAA